MDYYDRDKAEVILLKWLFKLNNTDSIKNILGKDLCGCHIEEQGGSFFLSSENWDGEIERSKVYSLAQEWINMINGIVSQVDGGMGLSIDTPICVDERGCKTIFLESSIPMAGKFKMMSSIEIKTYDAEGNLLGIQKSIDPYDSWFSILNIADEKMKKVLYFRAQPENWVNLYKVYEAIIDDVTTQEFEKWMGKKHISLFTHTANSLSATKGEGRHGKESNQPPQEPMKLFEAKNFIHKSMEIWKKHRLDHNKFN